MLGLRDQVLVWLRTRGAAETTEFLDARVKSLNELLARQMNEVVEHQDYVALANAWQCVDEKARAYRSRSLSVLNVSYDELASDLLEFATSCVLRLLATMGHAGNSKGEALVATLEHALGPRLGPQLLDAMSMWGRCHGILFDFKP
jgi:hypothetical protein